MKGKISLQEFINDVKNELITSFLKDPSGLFKMEDVQLEVNFGVQLEAGVGFKFFVVDATTKTTALQSHKVTIKLTPLVDKFLAEQKAASKKATVPYRSGIWLGDEQEQPGPRKARAATKKDQPSSRDKNSPGPKKPVAATSKKDPAKKTKPEKPSD